MLPRWLGAHLLGTSCREMFLLCACWTCALNLPVLFAFVDRRAVFVTPHLFCPRDHVCKSVQVLLLVVKWGAAGSVWLS